MIRIHHLLIDGWSVTLIVQALLFGFLGAALADDQAVDNYADYVAHDRALATSAEGAAMAAFWRNQLHALPGRLNLSYDRAPTGAQIGASGVVSRVFDAATSRRLLARAGATGSSYFAVMFAAFNLLLHDLSGASDIAVTSYAANRNRPQFRNTIGWVTNPLVLRNRVVESMTADAFLAQVGSGIAGAVANQEFPAMSLFPGPRSDAGSLYQFDFGVRRPGSADAGLLDLLLQGGAQPLRFGGYAVAAVDLPNAGCNSDFYVSVQETAGIVDLEWKYNADVFDRTTIERFVARYMSILSALLRDGDRTLGDILGRRDVKLNKAAE